MVRQLTWLMQFQADILERAGAAARARRRDHRAGCRRTAALATPGFWRDTGELRANWHESKRWTPSWTEERRAGGCARLAAKAVQRTLDWVEVD